MVITASGPAIIDHQYGANNYHNVHLSGTSAGLRRGTAGIGDLLSADRYFCNSFTLLNNCLIYFNTTSNIIPLILYSLPY